MIRVIVSHDNLVFVRDRTKARSDAAVARFATELYSKILSRSPFRSGKFRANWNVSVGSPSRSTVNTTTTDFSKASRLLKRLEGKDVYIGNFLPYAKHIEYGLYPPGPNTHNGFSKQAIGGVLKPSLQSLVGSFT